MWVVQVFPKLGPDTKLLLVPPTYGSHNPCTAGKPTVWCTNQTYDQWLAINRGNFVRPTDDSTALAFNLTLARRLSTGTGRSRTSASLGSIRGR